MTLQMKEARQVMRDSWLNLAKAYKQSAFDNLFLDQLMEARANIYDTLLALEQADKFKEQD